jgi:hypothetical protein
MEFHWDFRWDRMVVEEDGNFSDSGDREGSQSATSSPPSSGQLSRTEVASPLSSKTNSGTSAEAPSSSTVANVNGRPNELVSSLFSSRLSLILRLIFSLSPAAIAGIIIGVAAVLLLAAALVILLFWYRRRNLKRAGTLAFNQRCNG